MATVTITSDVASLFSHDVYFELILEDSSTASYSAELLDFGKLKYEFDIPNSGEDATAIGVKSGAMEVTFSDFLASDTLISVIESAYNYASKPKYWKSNMYFREKGGSYGNPIIFKFNQNDVEYSEEEKSLSITLNPFQVPAMMDGGFFNSVFEFMSFFNVATFDYYTLTYSPSGYETTSSAFLAGEFIRSVLYKGYTDNFFRWPPPTGNEPIFKSNVFVKGAVGVDSPASGTEWFVVQNHKDIIGPNTNNLINALQVVGRLASLEGAIFGSALGRSFYVVKRNTDNSVELDWDNVLKPEKIRFLDSEYYQLILTHGAEVVTVVSDNFAAEKSMNINFPQSGIYRATISDSDSATETTFTDEIIQEGALNYPKSFGFGDAIFYKLKYWGIGDIKPWSVITFDVDAPAYLTSKNFRIKNIEYDWKKDIVEMEIYEI